MDFSSDDLPVEGVELRLGAGVEVGAALIHLAQLVVIHERLYDHHEWLGYVNFLRSCSCSILFLACRFHSVVLCLSLITKYFHFK